MHIHVLGGCTPTPLANYLKALGVLRLVSEQRDASARGWWQDESFRLATVLDREQLVRFFADEYAPSPITSPWNRGSGLLAAADANVAALAGAKATRFAAIAEGIAAAQAISGQQAQFDAEIRAIKSETKGLSKVEKAKLRGNPDYKRRLAEAERRFKDAKDLLVPRCRAVWRGVQRRWLDAAVVLLDGDAVWPALLGTGGNDGRLDFTYNYYKRLGVLFDLDSDSGAPRDPTRATFEAALFGVSAPQVVTKGDAVGQYSPGCAGGANATNGPTGDSGGNPADFVLMLEGSIMFTAHGVRRFDVDARKQASVPFAVRSRASGYGSAAQADESARGEQWMPFWSGASSLAEVSQLLSEGRARLGVNHAQEPLDVARAAARLGTARGVRFFERFGYIERNGQSNLAVPIGRYRVLDAPPHELALLDELDGWLARLRRQSRDDNAGARLRHSEHRLADALLAVVDHGEEPRRWQGILLALAEVEAVLASGSGFAAGPIPPLSAGWIDAADDGTAEFRLAVAFARQGARLEKGGAGGRWDGVRRHWVPLAGRGFAISKGDGSNPRLERRPEVVAGGRDGIADAIAVLSRRLLEGSPSGGARQLALEPRDGEPGADLGDLGLLLRGRVDLDRVLALARPLMATVGRCGAAARAATPPQGWPDDAWLVLRLALLPWPIDAESTAAPRTDPSIVRRLAAGDTGGAFEVARRRLRASGVPCPLQLATLAPADARRWAAALAFPITRASALAILARIAPDAGTEKGRLA